MAGVLVKNYCKIWKIKPCKSGEFRTLFYHERKSVLLCGNVVILLSRNKNVYRIRKIHIRIFSELNYILQRSFTHNFTKFLKLFPNWLKLFAKLKFWLIEWWSISLPLALMCFVFMRICRILLQTLQVLGYFFLEKELSMELINNSFYSPLQIPLPFLNLFS